MRGTKQKLLNVELDEEFQYVVDNSNKVYYISLDSGLDPINRLIEMKYDQDDPFINKIIDECQFYIENMANEPLEHTKEIKLR